MISSSFYKIKPSGLGFTISKIDFPLVCFINYIFYLQSMSDIDEPIHIINVAIRSSVVLEDNEDEVISKMFENFCKSKVRIRI